MSEYAQSTLDESSVDADPIRQFEIWFAEAQAARLSADPTAMTLATATPDGVPSARIVLLKSVSPSGFVFFTDYRSRKGNDLAFNPRAALVFWWPELERQVRITGTVSRVPTSESEVYFRTRPLGSRLGAWSSHQSQILASRDPLERRFAEMQTRYADADVPLPPHWGGYLVAPDSIEFWQGRVSRLHDRLRYIKTPDASWTLERLSP